MVRRKIFDSVKANRDVFECEQPTYIDEVITLYGPVSILTETDYEKWWDEEEISGTIRGRLDEFAQGKFSEINRIIVECLEDYRSGSR